VGLEREWVGPGDEGGVPLADISGAPFDVVGAAVAGAAAGVREGEDDTSILVGSAEPICQGVCVTCGGLSAPGPEIEAVAEGNPGVAALGRVGFVMSAGIAVGSTDAPARPPGVPLGGVIVDGAGVSLGPPGVPPPGAGAPGSPPADLPGVGELRGSDV
jgi:hypothetical protein